MFLKNHAENKAGILVPDFFLFFSGLQFNFNVSIALNLAYNKNKLTLDYWSRDMLNFVLNNGLGIASPPHFVYDFSRKMFLTLYSIKLTWFHCLIAFTSWDIGQYRY